MRTRIAMLVAGAVHAAASAGSAQTVDLGRARLMDLTHEIASDGPAWPGSRAPFRLDTLVASPTAAMFRLTLNEHFGTHLDAPRHGSGTGWTNEQIPLSRLMGPAVVIDVTAQSAANRDYGLSVADLAAHEREFGPIPPGAIVLLRTGWARYWGQPAYFGADTTVTPTRLHFPSLGAASAQALVERGIALFGVDSPSTDFGASPSFAVHGLLARANIPSVENLADLGGLPRTGAVVMALPIKTRGGSGGPVRVVALVP